MYATYAMQLFVTGRKIPKGIVNSWETRAHQNIHDLGSETYRTSGLLLLKSWIRCRYKH